MHRYSFRCSCEHAIKTYLYINIKLVGGLVGSHESDGGPGTVHFNVNGSWKRHGTTVWRHIYSHKYMHTYIDEAVDYVDDESTFIITCKCTSQNVGGIVGFGFLAYHYIFQWGRSHESIPHTHAHKCRTNRWMEVCKWIRVPTISC